MRATLNDAGIPQAIAGYDAWGVPQSAAIAPFGFTGELQQGSDVWLRARWYGTGRGGFASRDPFAGNAEMPYSLMAYQYAYSAPTMWTDPTGQVVGDPMREPTTCPPGMFAACYEAFAQQHGNNRHLHASENANFAFFDAYHDAALAYQSPDGRLPYDLALWRLQYQPDAVNRSAFRQAMADECGPAAGIVGMAEGANELDKSLARTYRTAPRLGIQQGGNNTNPHADPDEHVISQPRMGYMGPRTGYPNTIPHDLEMGKGYKSLHDVLADPNNYRNPKPLIGADPELSQTTKFIFVIDDMGNIRLGSYRTHHHPDLVDGANVYGAGEIFIDPHGNMVSIDNFSGHYGPKGSEFFPYMKRLLNKQGIGVPDNVFHEFFFE